ncbi:TPA: hypothetical protein ACRRX3_001503 [Morganella morganii]
MSIITQTLFNLYYGRSYANNNILISAAVYTYLSVTGVIPADGYRLFFTWLHIITGLSFRVSGTLLIALCFHQRGIKHYYPWVFGCFPQIAADCRALLHGKLPESSPGGLATSVQGPGHGAMGLLHFILWLRRKNTPDNNQPD